MALKSRKGKRMTLDKVESKKLIKVRAMFPEYKDLDLDQIAHLELKNRLFELERSKTEIIKNDKTSPLDKAPFVKPHLLNLPNFAVT